MAGYQWRGNTATMRQRRKRLDAQWEYGRRSAAQQRRKRQREKAAA